MFSFRTLQPMFALCFDLQAYLSVRGLQFEKNILRKLKAIALGLPVYFLVLDFNYGI